jgi:hypothetical protein
MYGMAQRAQQRTPVGEWVPDLPTPATDGREPWPTLSVTPAARQLLARGQLEAVALDALPTGKHAALPRLLQRVAATGVLPSVAPPPASPAGMPTPQPIPIARVSTGQPIWQPRVVRMATPVAPPGALAHQGAGPIRVKAPEAAAKTLGFWAAAAFVLGLLSLVPLVWDSAPIEWVPATAGLALLSGVSVLSRARSGVTPVGTIRTARWGCAFALLATTLWIVGILLVTGQFNPG